ncbi:reverse transcriptase domain-containing protein [Tanacetum coccineum]
MPTWCHMFNSTLIGAARVWFDELPPESIDGYKGFKAAFLAFFMQQKKYVKDLVEIHNNKKRDGETIEDFIEQFKVETGRMKRAPECMRISGFMHGVNNPELTKRLNEHVPKTMKEMMTITTAFIRGESAVASKKKGHSSWKSQDQSKRHAPERKSDFRDQPREEMGSNRFTPLPKHPKISLRPSTDECMQLKKQIEELVRVGKLSHLIKEIKQGRDQTKNKKKEARAKDKSLAIYMIQPWQRTKKQKLTQSFAYGSEITFSPLANSDGIEGPLVIEAEIGRHMIHRMYIDGGSSMEILYEHCFNQLRPEIKSQMVPTRTSLTGFSRETIWPLGQLRLLVTIRDVDHCIKAWMDFMIVRSISPYNGIIGRPGIREIQAVPSTAHGMLKFPADGGIVTIRSTILIPAECATMITSPKEIPKEARVRCENLKPRSNDRSSAILVCTLGSISGKDTRPSDRLKKGSGPRMPKAIQAEVQKLVEAGIMREVYYQDWLSNPVMVKKHDGSWRMCVDFIDLNKACLQDCYPLLEINWKIESLRGYLFKCFLDAYKGYHQIQMAESNEEKTAFHTSQGVYCYTKMPFGLKNADATYQRIVDKACDSRVGRNMEVYVDDLVIKSHIETKMLRDIDETFRTLRKINMKLNPKKCTFGAVEGMFLGYTITLEGIKPCSDKTEVVLQLPSPWTIKEVQNVHQKSDFSRSLEANKHFMLLKQHLLDLPLLVAPKLKEELIIYLSASYGAVSVVLMTERGTVQTPVYFISRALQGLELNYTPMENLVMSLVFAAKRLQGYFQVHPIAAITDQPIKQIISRPDVAGRSGTGLILTNSEGAEFTYALWFQFTASNNEAKYEALIAGLQIVAQMGVRNIQVSVDSKLVAYQVLGMYVAKEENTIKYLEKVKSLVSGFASFSISQIPRSKNKKADALSKIASTSFAHLSKQVLVEVLTEKLIQEKEVTIVVEEERSTWMTPIVEYLKDETLPGDRKEASKLRIKAKQYELMEGILYRLSFLKPWLRTAISSSKGYAAGILLADHAPGRKGYDTPFPEGPGKVKFLIVAMDYFTKWIKAKAVATITGNQSNGLVERANRSLGKGIKARLGEGNKNWIEELPHVLWAHRTMIKSSHGDTPFSLTYGTKAVIPAEIGMPTYRTAKVDTVHNDEELWLNLDLLEEKRERAAICEAKSKMKMAKYYNARVRSVSFRTGDFVYRSNDASYAAAGGKLRPKWEGPYEATEMLGEGAYKLRTMDGADLPRTWNIANLKKCYL